MQNMLYQSIKIFISLQSAKNKDTIFFRKKKLYLYSYSWVCVLRHFSRVQLLVTVTLQAPLSMGFSRQEYWSGLPCPPPGDLPDPGIEPASLASPALQEDSLLLSHQGSPIHTPKCTNNSDSG